MTESRAAFAAALVAFQKELPRIGKTQTATVETRKGGTYSYAYADLADVTSAVVEVLSKHGLAWTAAPAMTEHGFVLRCSLLHEAGHSEGGEYPLPDPANHSPQEIGSALTYARRYALTALTGVAPTGEDDDGQKAAQSRARPAASDPLAMLKHKVVAAGQMVNLSTVEALSEKFAEINGGLPLAQANATELELFLTWLDDERKRGARQHKALVADVNNTTQAGKTRKDSPDRGRVERLPGTPDDDPFYVRDDEAAANA